MSVRDRRETAALAYLAGRRFATVDDIGAAAVRNEKYDLSRDAMKSIGATVARSLIRKGLLKKYRGEMFETCLRIRNQRMQVHVLDRGAVTSNRAEAIQRDQEVRSRLNGTEARSM